MTVGHELGFDRIVRAMDAWAVEHPAETVFAQIAEIIDGCYIPANIEYVEFLKPNEFADCFERAKLVVSHAGMGTIITAQTMGKPLVMMPRRGKLKETRNDHQVATVKKFETRPGIFAAYEERQLASVVDRALMTAQSPDVVTASSFAEPSLIAAVRDFIHET